MIVFKLTMPNRGSWNGKWSGENDLHVIVKHNEYVPKDVIGKSFYYRWDDGWCACIDVQKVPAAEARKMSKKSTGFCGYNWMVDSIIKNGCIKKEGT